MIQPIEIARLIAERNDHQEHEDEAHRLLGIDTGKEQEDLICTVTQDGKALIPESIDAE
jgi:hypothetical protein